MASPVRISLQRDAAELHGRRAAGFELLETMSTLQRRNGNVIAELVSHTEPRRWEHYPHSDVFDAQTGFRYYYHCHESPGGAAEHGHLHLYAQVGGESDADEFTHLIAIGLDATGLPRRAFTTNRWVTGGQWQPAFEVIRKLEDFRISRPRRFQRVHRWLEALLRFFHPQLRALLHERDRRCEQALTMRPGLLEDRRTYVLAQRRLDLVSEFAMLDRLEPRH